MYFGTICVSLCDFCEIYNTRMNMPGTKIATKRFPRRITNFESGPYFNVVYDGLVLNRRMISATSAETGLS